MKEFKEYEEFKEGNLFGRMIADSAGHAGRMNVSIPFDKFYNRFFWRVAGRAGRSQPHPKIE
jgi:hypothetical protein